MNSIQTAKNLNMSRKTVTRNWKCLTQKRHLTEQDPPKYPKHNFKKMEYENPLGCFRR